MVILRHTSGSYRDRRRGAGQTPLARVVVLQYHILRKQTSS
jgi:hypothetical protein